MLAARADGGCKLMASLTRWVLAHKRIVVSFWLILTLVGVVTVGSSTSAFSTKFTVPGREGFATNEKIARLYHNGGDTAPLVAVVTLPAGISAASPQVRSGLEHVEATLRRAI